MLIGYARVSTRRQRLDLQHSALEAVKCDLIISERRSGANGIGTGLETAIGACGKGDRLVVWKLDRLGRNIIELMGVIERLRGHGAGLKVLTGAVAAIDINAAEGEALFAIYAAFAALELDMNRQRTACGRNVSKIAQSRRANSVKKPTKCAAYTSSLRCAFNKSKP